jgi:protoheme IX farnesyltransferase
MAEQTVPQLAPPAPPASPQAGGAGAAVAYWLVALRSSVADYVRLTKPRIISLLLVTAVCCLYAGADGRVRWTALLAVCGGGYLAAGGANAMNCALDADLDTLMHRTRSRPVPSGRIHPAAAIGYGIALNIAAAVWLGTVTNLLAAGLALAGSAWYVVVYTRWLKRRSTENIVIGGAAGCFPVLVGWAAATGRLDATAIVLAAVVFCWTPPHFWSLASLLRDDYRRAQVPMLPVVASAAHTSRRMLRYAAATLVVSVLPVAWGGLGVAYLGVAVLSGARLCQLTAAFRAHPDTRTARRLFGFSLGYLALIFAAAALDRSLGAPVVRLW